MSLVQDCQTSLPCLRIRDCSYVTTQHLPTAAVTGTAQEELKLVCEVIIIDTELYCNYSASHEAAHSSQPGTVCQLLYAGSPLGD